MSLAVRLTLSFAGLILALGLAAFFGVRALTDDLTSALGETAASVSRSVVTVLRGNFKDDAGSLADHTAEAKTIELVGPDPVVAHRDIRMVVDGHELSAAEVAERMRSKLSGARIELRRGKDGAPPMLWVSGADREQSIELPRRGMDEALQRFQHQLGWGLLSLLAIGIGIAAWLAQRLARPLARLTKAAETVGSGTLGVQVSEQGPPELRRSLAAFNRMSADLQRLDREASALRADRELAELGEIGRGLAHSLRNPLHALGLSLEALAVRAPDSPEVSAMASAGRDQLTRIDQALRGFLALAAGVGAESESVSLVEIIDDVLLEATQRASGKVKLRREGADIAIRGVPAELRILLHALVVNALEASPDGGTVTVDLRHGDDAKDGALLVIDDHGAGIPEAIRLRLFLPHVSSKPTGAGMGLYLAQRLARLRYGGDIALLDRDCGGTRAQLRLRNREEHANA